MQSYQASSSFYIYSIPASSAQAFWDYSCWKVLMGPLSFYFPSLLVFNKRSTFNPKGRYPARSRHNNTQNYLKPRSRRHSLSCWQAPQVSSGSVTRDWRPREHHRQQLWLLPCCQDRKKTESSSQPDCRCKSHWRWKVHPKPPGTAVGSEGQPDPRGITSIVMEDGSEGKKYLMQLFKVVNCGTLKL